MTYPRIRELEVETLTLPSLSFIIIILGYAQVITTSFTKVKSVKFRIDLVYISIDAIYIAKLMGFEFPDITNTLLTKAITIVIISVYIKLSSKNTLNLISL